MAKITDQVVFVPWDEAITPCVCGLEIWWPFGVWKARCDCGLHFSKVDMATRIALDARCPNCSETLVLQVNFRRWLRLCEMCGFSEGESGIRRVGEAQTRVVYFGTIDGKYEAVEMQR